MMVGGGPLPSAGLGASGGGGLVVPDVDGRSMLPGDSLVRRNSTAAMSTARIEARAITTIRRVPRPMAMFATLVAAPVRRKNVRMRARHLSRRQRSRRISRTFGVWGDGGWTLCARIDRVSRDQALANDADGHDPCDRSDGMSWCQKRVIVVCLVSCLGVGLENAWAQDKAKEPP